MSEEEEKKEDGPLGPMQYSVRSCRDVLWTIQICNILVTCVAIGATMIYMRFVLKPLIMSYFLTFLQGPIMDLLEKRPYAVGGKTLCMAGYKNKARLKFSRRGGLKYDMANLTMMAKIPHGIAALLTIFISIGVLAGVAMIISASVNGFLAEEEERVEKGEEAMSVKLNKMLNELVASAEEGGFAIALEEYCDIDVTDIDISQNKTDDGHTELSVKIFGVPDCSASSDVDAFIEAFGEEYTSCDDIYGTDVWDCEDSTVVDLCCNYCARDDLGSDFWALKRGYVSPVGETPRRCFDIELFGNSDGYTMDEISAGLGAISVIMNDTILVILLCVYILLDRPEGATISGDYKVARQCEAMCKAYVSLKTMISAMTGVLVAFFLTIFGVPLGPIFGLMAFILNYIPNVGSILATIMPLPIILLMERSTVIKCLAFGCPAMVQGYVGNALEPVLFGKTLNLTAISILLSLVVFAYLWGIVGAIYSVPLLGVLKIVCHNNDHPLSKVVVKMVQESEEIEAEADLKFEEAMEEEKRFKDEFEKLVLEATDEYEAELDSIRKSQSSLNQS